MMPRVGAHSPTDHAHYEVGGQNMRKPCTVGQLMDWLGTLPRESVFTVTYKGIELGVMDMYYSIREGTAEEWAKKHDCAVFVHGGSETDPQSYSTVPQDDAGGSLRPYMGTMATCGRGRGLSRLLGLLRVREGN